MLIPLQILAFFGILISLFTLFAVPFILMSIIIYEELRCTRQWQKIEPTMAPPPTNPK